MGGIIAPKKAADPAPIAAPIVAPVVEAAAKPDVQTLDSSKEGKESDSVDTNKKRRVARNRQTTLIPLESGNGKSSILGS